MTKLLTLLVALSILAGGSDIKPLLDANNPVFLFSRQWPSSAFPMSFIHIEICQPRRTGGTGEKPAIQKGITLLEPTRSECAPKRDASGGLEALGVTDAAVPFALPFVEEHRLAGVLLVDLEDRALAPLDDFVADPLG